ncbi:SPASM domain-containing protein [Thiorhodococcus minor]|uniref:Radical SAM protein n=1 Tax=Thiorhodococcus minor TaxID=57489 RepID=A0A6M0K1A5_9GAMM|nr:SPASM domain-containing protein [Thiorhodococcus minor]NEV62397.1 radical SAM protein [Thiorhodococcus minor]
MQEQASSAEPGETAAPELGRPHARTMDLGQGGLGRSGPLKDFFCPRPWEHFEVSSGGVAWVCCPAWLSTPIGNCREADIMDIWNSAASQRIRASILDGSFAYCGQQECPVIQNGSLMRRNALPDARLERILAQGLTVIDEPPRTFNLCYDESCNLACPSCRAQPIHHTRGPAYEERLAIQRRITSSLFSEPHTARFQVNVTGSGDPLGAKLMRDLLLGIDGARFPNVTIHLQTNGVLLTPKYWRALGKIHDNLGQILVSFDAATPETYAYTRRGGDWERLNHNTRFLAERRAEGAFDWLRLDFVVQKRNFREIPAFVELAQRLRHVDQVTFALISDWGSYSPEAFAEHAVWRRDHPEHEAFLEGLRSPILDDPMVYLGNVAEYRRQALRDGETR